MKHKFTVFSGFFMVALFATCCESEKLLPENVYAETGFFPVKEGAYRVYQVEKIDFSLVNENDTSRYQLKEVVSGSYLNQEGDTTFVLSRFTRKEENANWAVDSVRAIRKDPGRIIVTADNIPVVKLVYPVREGLAWDGNALNALQEDEYEIMNVNAPFDTGITNFPNTLTVIENNNPDSVIFQDYRKAIYADGIGLIYREEKILHYCAATVDCLGQGIIESGHKYKQEIISYGKE